MTTHRTDQAGTQGEPSGVPLVDVTRQYESLEGELLAALGRVCASGRYVLGPDCQELEETLAGYCHAPYAIGCASGSDALLLALMACDVRPGDQVIVPSYTFFATAAAVSRLGARPVFVDIDPATYNLDPAKVAEAITPATKAMIPVHLYGQCANMNALVDLGRRHGIFIIEDAAQAIGAELDSRRAGSLADVGCFSFYPTKNLGGCGDGGLLTTRSQHLAEKLRLLRVHGMHPRYHHHVLGINSRLDSLQAAVLRVKFPYLEGWIAARREHAQRYSELFTAAGLGTVLTLPSEVPSTRHVWNQYVIRVGRGQRDALREHLTSRRIGTEIYYPIPLDAQPCFSYLRVPRGRLPETERAAQETLALPIFPELTPAEQDVVVQEVAAFFGKQALPRRAPVAAPKFLKQDSPSQQARS